MVTLWIRVAGICNKCEGSRSELGYTGKSCPYCEGTGYETIRTGHIVSRRDCSYCKGTKIFYKYKCIECAGKGRILYSRPFYIDIPPGVEHGQLLKFPVSHEILDIPPDEKERERILYVTLNVKDSNFFRREGMDLHSHIRLSPALALLGGSIEYEGLTVNCDLPIDCCTSSHTTLVVNQAGVHSENYRGDHLLTTVLKVPKKLTWRQRRAFLRFAALENLNSSGTIAGVEGELDHRFSVNVQVPDKTCNPCLAGALHNQEKPDLYKRLRTKFLELHDKYPILNRLYD